MVEFDVPNLDDQWASDLKVVSEVLHQLGTYAELRSQAMGYRYNGEIQPAICLEAQCDEIYKMLPEWARW
jgi:hypothetical protein